MNQSLSPSSNRFERLRRAITEKGANPLPPVTMEQISAFESTNRVTIPRTLREYLLNLNGTGWDDMDNDMISFFKLDEIVPLVELSPESVSLVGEGSWFVVGDHSIGINYYVIDFVTGRVLVVYPAWKEEAVVGWAKSETRVHPPDTSRQFDSFEQFIDTYISEGYGGLT